MDVFDLVFFRTGIIVLFAASLIDKPKRAMPDYINKIILGLLGLCVFNLFIHTFAPQVLAMTMNLFLAIVGLYILYTYLDEKANLVKYILWGAAINLIFLVSQRIGFDPIFDQIPNVNNKPALNQTGAFFGNNPRIANYFTLVIPFLPLIWLPIGLILYFLTKQMVIFIPIVIILFTRLETLKSKIGFLAIIALSLFLFKAHILQSLSIRFAYWKPALEAFFDRPLIGYGLGTKIFPDLDAYFNSYLSFINGVGILGLVWLGYVFKNVYKKIGRNKESIALVTLALLMAIEYPIEHTRLWYLIIAIIVMWLIKKNKEVESAIS